MRFWYADIFEAHQDSKIYVLSKADYHRTDLNTVTHISFRALEYIANHYGVVSFCYLT